MDKSYTDIVELIKLIAKDLNAEEESIDLLSGINESFKTIQDNIVKQRKIQPAKLVPT